MKIVVCCLETLLTDWNKEIKQQQQKRPLMPMASLLSRVGHSRIKISIGKNTLSLSTTSRSLGGRVYSILNHNLINRYKITCKLSSKSSSLTFSCFTPKIIFLKSQDFKHWCSGS